MQGHYRNQPLLGVNRIHIRHLEASSGARCQRHRLQLLQELHDLVPRVDSLMHWEPQSNQSIPIGLEVAITAACSLWTWRRHSVLCCCGYGPANNCQYHHQIGFIHRADSRIRHQSGSSDTC